jgi:hypothetical protein
MIRTVLWLLSLLGDFFCPRITTPKTIPDPIQGIEQDGALIPNGAIVAALGQLQASASPAFGNWSQTLIPNTLLARTYTGAEMVSGLIRRAFPSSAATTDCTDTATNIIAAIPGAKPNQTFLTFVLNMGSTALTIAGGTGVTVAGSALVQSNSARLFQGQITGSAAVTFSSVFAFPLGSLSPLTVAQ